MLVAARAFSGPVVALVPASSAASTTNSVPLEAPAPTAACAVTRPELAAASEPSVHCTVLPTWVPPPVADTKLVPAGSGSTSVVPVMLAAVRLP